MRALVRSIAIEGQGQVEALIQSVAEEGGTSTKALTEMVRDQTLGAALRSNVCWLIARTKSPEASTVLLELLSDPSEQVREEAAVGIGLVVSSDVEEVGAQDDAVQRLLLAVDHDPSKPVRLASLHALGMIGSPTSATGLLEVLHNPGEDAEVRADAAEACAHLRDNRIVDALITVLADGSPIVRYSAAYALGEQGDVKAIPMLTELASRDDATTKWGSVASSAAQAIQSLASRH